DRRVAQRRLDALVLNLATVEDLGGEAGRRRRHPLQQQVRRVACEAGQLPRQTAVHQEPVDTTLELLEAFRLYLVPAGNGRYDETLLSAELRCRQRRELLTEQRLVARLAVCRADLHLAART